jgi:hypothetical protein
MTGSMDQRGDDNSDNSSDITELTDSVDLDQAPVPFTTSITNANPDSSIVLDTIPGNTAPVTQPSTTRKGAKSINHTSGPSTTASGSSHPPTRRSARLSGLPSPDADQSTSISAQAGASNTGGAVGKGKKRAQAEETEAGSSKKQ